MHKGWLTFVDPAANSGVPLLGKRLPELRLCPSEFLSYFSWACVWGGVGGWVGVTWRVVGFEDSITSNKFGHVLLPFKLNMVGCVISCLFGGGGKVFSFDVLSQFPLLKHFFFFYCLAQKLFFTIRIYCTDF